MYIQLNPHTSVYNFREVVTHMFAEKNEIFVCLQDIYVCEKFPITIKESDMKLQQCI